MKFFSYKLFSCIVSILLLGLVVEGYGQDVIVNIETPDSCTTEYEMDDGSLIVVVRNSIDCSNWVSPVIQQDGLLTVMVVAGGGGGGKQDTDRTGAGGGGAGGINLQEINIGSFIGSTISFDFMIGDGGRGSCNANLRAENGSSSSLTVTLPNGNIFIYSALGGGGGGSSFSGSIAGDDQRVGGTGGSGGGSVGRDIVGGQNSGPNSFPGGGGTGNNNGTVTGGGGGGGAGGPHIQTNLGNGLTPGGGGPGISPFFIPGFTFFGGGGGGVAGTPGNPQAERFEGAGGSGVGGSGSISENGGNGLVNTGSGGGAGSSFAGACGGNGADGVVILRFANFFPLPVEYLYREARFLRKTSSAMISWATTKEWEASHFEIERATQGLNFEKIGEVDAAGWSDAIIEYEYEDESLPLTGGNVLYRLKQIDFDGTFSYSSVMSVRVPSAEFTSGVWRAYPNPTDGNELSISLLDAGQYNQEPLTFRLIHPTAQTRPITVASELGMNEILSQMLLKIPKGVFVVEIQWGQKVEHIKVLKQ